MRNGRTFWDFLSEIWHADGCLATCFLIAVLAIVSATIAIVIVAISIH